MTISRFLAALFFLCLAACTTAPPIEPIPDVVQPKSQAPMSQAPDLSTLERTLRMDRSKADLGFEEKAFNPCDQGFPAADARACASQFLVVIHFQLQCRDKDGTVEQYNVEPIVSDNVRWVLGKSQGTTRTDHEGFGQLSVIAPTSQRASRFRLTIGNNFMILRAEDIRKVVTPPDWCGGRG
jgi:hypothetical protein